jgi:hypothetical protein
MRMLPNRASHPPILQLVLGDAVRATLQTTFTAARLILAWDDEPTVVPGFQVRANGLHVVVRYIQPRAGAPSVRRAQARAMLEQYRLALLAQRWQVDLVDEPRKTPYLRCYAIDNVMSNKETPCLIP